MTFSAANSHQISENLLCLDQTAQPVTFWLTQTAIGEVESFFSTPTDLFSAHVDQIVRQSLTTALFRPVDPDAYCCVIDRIITTGRAGSLSWPFVWNGVPVTVAMTMSPIAQPNGRVNTVLVQGTCEVMPLLAVASGLDVANRYHLLLTQISWNIRRTLDLRTIWQQTVDGLGATLSIDRCSIYALDENAGQVKIEAEYCGTDQESWYGRAEALEPQLSFRQAIALLRPSPLNDETLPDADHGSVHSLESPESLSESDDCVVTDQVEEDGLIYQRMIVATGYQDEVNGLIVLWRSPTRPDWNEAELNFLEELADQVGTAIAHAALFNERERVNRSLVLKQEALEEAIAQAKEASRLKSEFLANTSHELRTPLNGMIGFLKLILDGMADDPEEQQEFLEEALKSAEHLLDLINDVLDIAKIESGKFQLELSSVALADVFDQLQQSQKNSATRKNLTFEIQIPQTRDAVMIWTNYRRLYQVLINLVGNAIKFTHEGGITIATEFVKRKVTIQNHECPGLVMVRVADTGIGVSLEKQDRLFQSFSQIDGSTTRRYGGTGLGLAISQNLVNEMGGEVNFYSMGEGLGSTVTFTIPLFQEPIA
jgi:signal transduction histidine kinase